MQNSVATSLEVEILNEVKRRQQAEGLNNIAFSKKIGVTRQCWEAILHNVRRPGPKVWRGIVSVYPELAPKLSVLAQAMFFATEGED